MSKPRSSSKPGANLPENLLKQINATHSRTREIRRNPKFTRARAGTGRKKLLKGIGARNQRPVDLARRRKFRQFDRFKDEEDEEDFGLSSDEDARRPSRQEPGKSVLKKALQDPEPDSEPESESRSGYGSAFESEIEDRSMATAGSASVVKSKTTKAALEEHDAEISALERKLGLKGTTKLPKSFEDDGLGELLEGLEVMSDRKRKRDDLDEFLRNKRRKRLDRADGKLTLSTTHDRASFADEELEDGASMGEVGDSDEDERETSTSDVEKDGDDFSGFSDEGPQETPPARVRENPYRPPIPAGQTFDTTKKYVPPSLRGAPSSDTEALAHLRRKLQGLLNRLSEANIRSIVSDVENAYTNNPRQHVTTTLIDLLMALLCDRTSLNDTFIILHAGFIAAVYKVIGPQFGAQLVERIVTTFDKLYSEQKSAGSTTKEMSNLVALVAEMYTLQVVSSSIMFDYIRQFLDKLSNLNTELLLKLIKNCGPQLRKDDPLALKEIAALLQKSVAKAGGTNLSVRTKFMIELIDNLKNNKQTKGSANSQLVSEHIVRMKKTLGALNERSLKATEPLNIGLNDIRSSTKQGKWWLTGASWKNESITNEQPAIESMKNSAPMVKSKGGVPTDTGLDASENVDLYTLAKSLRLNTDVRRAIFLAIMSASDYQDAQVRLTKLRLNARQSQEISRVVLLLVGSEETYNPYYALVARKLCASHKFRMNFQYGLWGLFRKMGESTRFADGEAADAEDADTDQIDLRKVVSYAKFFAELVAEDALNLNILKVLNIPLLQRNTKVFLELLIVTLFTRVAGKIKEKGDLEGRIRGVFEQLDQNVAFAVSLRHFIESVVKRSELPANARERKIVKKSCDVALAVLMEIQTKAVTD